jgi:peptide/nickel transport system substrate-binding protein
MFGVFLVIKFHYPRNLWAESNFGGRVPKQYQGETMKKSLIKGIALVSASVLGATGLGLAPASAATVSVVIQETNTLTGLNTSIPGKNLVTNVNVLYPTGSGFTYWSNKSTLVRNTAFGTFKITRNNPGDFRVTYTVKKGLKWSDGTLITAQDLLLSHALSSSDYSVKAGLGDPTPADPKVDASNKFDSSGYGGPYDDSTTASSFDISDDNYSITVKYSSFQPDWQLFGPSPSPIHALVGMAKGKRTIQTARTNASYKSLFEEAYFGAYEALPPSNDEDYADALEARTDARKLMSTIANRWSTRYNITSVTSATNPLLLVSNGGYMIKSCATTSCTLVRNPLASVSGTPKMTGNVDQLVFAFPANAATYNDSIAAASLKNGEIDLYSGPVTQAGWAKLNENTNSTTVRANTATYEHLDLRVGSANSGANSECAATYTGPFAGNSEKARDTRKAFLLTVPRQLIANTYVAKVFDPNSTANSTILNSHLSLTTEPDYSKIIAGTGVKTHVAEFTKSQAERNAAALVLMKRHYTDAQINSDSVDVRFLRSTASRRADINLQIKLEAAKVGFNVTNVGVGNWPDYLNCNDYDAHLFAWSRSSISQTGSNAQYITEGGNNSYGWSSSTVDAAFNALEKQLSSTALISAKVAAEKAVADQSWSLPLYQWPGAASYNKTLKGVQFSPLTPNVIWNYWTFNVS